MRVIVHSKPDCPWCDKTKAFLLERHIPFDEIVHEEGAERQKLYDKLRLVGMERTVPQIILIDDDGEEMRVGGWDKLQVSGIASINLLGLGTESIDLAGSQEIHTRRIAAIGEPVFTVRAPDQFAPDTIRFWISKAEPGLGVNHPKIVAARHRLAEVEAWQEMYGRKHPD